MLDSYYSSFRKKTKPLQLGRIKRLLLHFRSYFDLWVYPGHYYSPLPNKQQSINYRQNLSIDPHQPVLGIQLHLEAQRTLLRKFQKHAHEMQFPATKQDAFRYFYENDMFSYSDATSLFGILREFNPKRIIEVGSGYSSALMLDYRDQYKAKIDITCIEPYPERLMAQLRKGDFDNSFHLIQSGVEEVNPSVFSALKSGDILFIDSSHVSKIGSDVNFLFFNILSLLNKGVIVHIHDVSWPFEYGMQVVEEGRSWNETYLTRAFLQHNDSFELLFWSSYLKEACPEEASQIENFNQAAFGTGGSIWIRKKA